MREQLPYGDSASAREEAGQPTLDRVCEPHPVLVDELEHDDRNERLRDAAYAETIMGAERYASLQHGETAGLLASRGTVIDQNECAGTSRLDDRVGRWSIRAASKGDAGDDDRQAPRGR